jgi:hypothetical protein
MVIHFRGPIGLVKDGVTGQEVRVEVVARCTYVTRAPDGPELEAMIQAELVRSLRDVIAAKTAAGTLQFKQLSAGMMPEVTGVLGEVIAASGLPARGVDVRELDLHFGVGGRPAAPFADAPASIPLTTVDAHPPTVAGELNPAGPTVPGAPVPSMLMGAAVPSTLVGAPVPSMVAAAVPSTLVAAPVPAGLAAPVPHVPSTVVSGPAYVPDRVVPMVSPLPPGPLAAAQPAPVASPTPVSPPLVRPAPAKGDSKVVYLAIIAALVLVVALLSGFLMLRGRSSPPPPPPHATGHAGRR